MITIAPVDQGPFMKTWDVTASAGTDQHIVITHGFLDHYTPVAPKFVDFVAEDPTGNGNGAAYTKQWTLGVVNTLTIEIDSAVTSGGGLAGTPQLRVLALMPQSIID